MWLARSSRRDQKFRDRLDPGAGGDRVIVELPRAAAQPPRRAMSSRLDSSQEDMGAYSSGDDAPSLGHSPNTSAKIEAGRQRVRATFLHTLKGKVR